MNQFSVLWSSTVSMSFKNITPAWQPTLGRVIHSAALRARARARRVQPFVNRVISAKPLNPRTPPPSSSSWQYRQHPTGCCRRTPPNDLRGRPPSTLSNLSSMRGGRRGVRKGGPNGTKGGGCAFQIVALLQKSEVSTPFHFFLCCS